MSAASIPPAATPGAKMMYLAREWTGPPLRGDGHKMDSRETAE
jgi:hypothetical protein